MYSWINSEGQTIKTKTVREFSELTGLRLSNCRSLACGHYISLHGYCAVHPKTRAKRKRMMTRLVNTRSGECEILGRSITSFSRKHNVCANDIWKLLKGHKINVKGWMLSKTVELTQESLADSCAEKLSAQSKLARRALLPNDSQ